MPARRLFPCPLLPCTVPASRRANHGQAHWPGCTGHSTPCCPAGRHPDHPVFQNCGQGRCATSQDPAAHEGAPTQPEQSGRRRPGDSSPLPREDCPRSMSFRSATASPSRTTYQAPCWSHLPASMVAQSGAWRQDRCCGAHVYRHLTEPASADAQPSLPCRSRAHPGFPGQVWHGNLAVCGAAPSRICWHAPLASPAVHCRSAILTHLHAL